MKTEKRSKQFVEAIRDTDGAVRKGVVKAQRRLKEDKQFKREMEQFRAEYTRR